MIQLKNPRKFWPQSSFLQKRQHENVQRNQAKTKDFSSRKFREKNGRKLFFRGLDLTRQERWPDEKRDHGGVQMGEESDERTIISAKGKKRQKNPKIRALKKASLSGKVIRDKNLGREVSLDRKVQTRKEASEDFGLQMDFVDCKCKFGKTSDLNDDKTTILQYQ